jgi:spore photoproduct lyase
MQISEISPSPAPPKPKLWVPRRVLVTPSALAWGHGRGIAERAAALGAEVVELRADRLPAAGTSAKPTARPRRRWPW